MNQVCDLAFSILSIIWPLCEITTSNDIKQKPALPIVCSCRSVRCMVLSDEAAEEVEVFSPIFWTYQW